MSGGSGTVRVDRAGARATVEWDRPPVNVFDIALLRDVATALRSTPVRSAHVVVLKGAHRRWSAGFDVQDHFAERVRPMFGAFRELLRALWELPVPTLGQVEGPCLGGGLELLSACDLGVAAASATFGQPEVRLGVFPTLAAAEAPRTLGPKRAAELLLLGETVTAERAETVGLVSRVVPDPTVDLEVARTADRIAGLRREALVLLKSAMREEPADRWARLDRSERIYLEELLVLPAAEEGLRAFLEKRAPVWPAP